MADMEKTVILAVGAAEVREALEYWQKEKSHREIRVFALDPLGVATLLTLKKKLYQSLSQFIAQKKLVDEIVDVPLKLAQTVVKKEPPLWLWIDVIRAELVKLLSHYYVLNELHRRFHFTRLIASDHAFMPAAVELFCKTHHIQRVRPVSTSGSSVAERLRALEKEVRFLWSHPRDVLSAFLRLQATKESEKKNKNPIILFSNGLNLASYHTLVTTLRGVRAITDRQGYRDRVYLAKYGLTLPEMGEKLSSVSLTKLEKLTRQLKKASRSLENLDCRIESSLINPRALKALVKSAVMSIVGRNSLPILKKYLRAQELISRYQPRLMLTTHDPGPSGLAWVKAAQKKNIPTAVLLHGSPSSVHFFFSDYQIVWSEKIKRKLVKERIKAERLKVGGHPIFADYAHYFKTHPKKEKQLVVGILTAGDGRHEWYQADYFYQLFSQLAKLKQPVKFLIRTHPMQRLKGIKELGEHFHLNLAVDGSWYLEEFVARCDIIITQDSSAALVPLIAHKPTIFQQPWFPFFDPGLVSEEAPFIRLSSWKTLPQIIQRLRKSKNEKPRRGLKHFVETYGGPLDERATTRLVQVIKQLVR